MANQNRIKMIHQYLINASAKELSSVAYRAHSADEIDLLSNAINALRTACLHPKPTRDPCALSCRVNLVSAGDKKIQVIKVIRAVTALGLKDAKLIADVCGVVKEVNDPAEAQRIKKELEAAGATVEIL